MRTYVRQVVIADFAAAVVAAIAAVGVRFGVSPNGRYLILSVVLPLIWILTLRVFGAYEWRFLGTGSDEFRRVLNAGLTLTGALALISYAVNNELSRLYLIISMQVIVVVDLVVRMVLRKRLHRLRQRGLCMSTVVAVGHASAVSQLICELRREPHHGLQVVAACLPAGATVNEVAGVPVVGDLDDTASVVRNMNAGTVAVLSCPEMDGIKLRTLAWELEKTGTDLCVAPALLDVAGPRTTVRPTGTDLAARGPPAAERAQAGGQGPVRPVGGRVRAHGAVAIADHDRARRQAVRRRPGAVHPDAGGQGRAVLQDLQVPDDGGKRRGAAPRREQRQRVRGRRALQDP
jgi:FlaA1/EpsC-like NDP-sugar epimerase